MCLSLITTFPHRRIYTYITYNIHAPILNLDLPPLHLSKVGVNPLFLGSFVSTAHIYRYTSWMTAAIHVNLLYNKNEKI